MVNIRGDVFLPNKPAWTVCLIWIFSIFVGYSVEKIKIPKLIGMLFSGTILRNIVIDEDNGIDLLSELPNSWSSRKLISFIIRN